MDQLSQIDLAFCIDLTRSMQPFIDAARRHIVTILAGLRSDERADLRVGLVGYRDHQDDNDRPIEVHAFTDDDAAMHRVLGSLQVGSAATNTDAAEAVFAGLAGVRDELAWRAQAFRVVVLIGDAPPHACGATAQPYPDRYPEGDPTGYTLNTLADALESSGLFLHALGMIPSTIPVHDAALQASFDRLARATGGTYRAAATAEDAIAVVEAIGRRVFRQMGFDRMLWERLVAAAEVAVPGPAEVVRPAAPGAMMAAAMPAPQAPAMSGFGAPPPPPGAPPAWSAPPSAARLAEDMGVSQEDVAQSLARLQKRGIAPKK